MALVNEGTVYKLGCVCEEALWYLNKDYVKLGGMDQVFESKILELWMSGMT